MSEHWKKRPKLSDLKKDYDNAKTYHDIKLDKIAKIRDIYNEPTTVQQRKGTQRLKSTYTSKLVKKQLRWAIPNIENPVLTDENLFVLTPKDQSVINETETNADILNYQWNTEIGKTSFVNESVRKLVIEGTCIVKVGWHVKTEKKEVAEKKPVFTSDPAKVNDVLAKAQQDPEMFNKLKQMYDRQGKVPYGVEIDIVEKEIVVENRPKLEVKDNRAIIIDPKAKGDFSNAKFLIDIQETDYATLKQNDSYFNLDSVKDYILNKYEDEASLYNSLLMKTDEEYDNFEFSDLARKKVVMYEYWGYYDVNGDGTLTPIVAAWINNKLVRLEENPFPHGKIPYAIALYEPDLNGTFTGETDVLLLEDDQKGLTGTIRAMQDITNDDTIGQEFIDSSIFESTVQRQNYERGKTVWLRQGANPREAIYRKETKPVPPVLFNMRQLYSEHATLLTGIENLDGGQQSRLTRGVAGSLDSVDAKNNREMEVLRRYLSMLETAGSLILSMNKEYLLSGYLYTKHNKIKIVQDIESLKDNYHIKIKVSTPAIDDAIARKIAFMLQTNGSRMSDRMATLHYIEIAKLWNRYDLVKAMEEELNQPPSQEQQLAQQLEIERLKLENNKIKLEILAKTKEMEYKDAKIVETLSTIDEKELTAKAKAELNLAQAEKMDAQVDLFRQEFDLIQSGTKRQWEKEDKEFQHLANLEREEVRTKREQENIRLKENSKEKNLDYIKRGTLENDTYDAADDIFRNILTKNSLDTSELTDDLPNIQKMPSVKQPMKKHDVRLDLDKQINDTINNNETQE